MACEHSTLSVEVTFYIFCHFYRKFGGGVGVEVLEFLLEKGQNN